MFCSAGSGGALPLAVRFGEAVRLKQLLFGLGRGSGTPQRMDHGARVPGSAAGNGSTKRERAFPRHTLDGNPLAVVTIPLPEQRPFEFWQTKDAVDTASISGWPRIAGIREPTAVIVRTQPMRTRTDPREDRRTRSRTTAKEFGVAEEFFDSRFPERSVVFRAEHRTNRGREIIPRMAHVRLLSSLHRRTHYERSSFSL